VNPKIDTENLSFLMKFFINNTNSYENIYQHKAFSIQHREPLTKVIFLTR